MGLARLSHHLYVYDEVKGIPAGTTVLDGNAILPASMIFQYTQQKSYAGFSNFFRYKLLLDKGGWWVDTDTICLKPFVFDQPYVFSTEWFRQQKTINSGIIRVPCASQLMAYTWRTCQAKDLEALRWGEVGPQLMGEAVKKFALDHWAQSPHVFCPVGFWEWEKVLDPAVQWDCAAETYAIHLWNEMWRRGGREKNQSYHSECLYEQLKQRYL